MERLVASQFPAKTLRICRRLEKIRPTRLADLLARVLLGSDRRRVVNTKLGVKLFIDPISHLGRTLVALDVYEPEVLQILHDNIRPGERVLDIGANEGVISIYAASLVGPTGLVMSVEPQARLRDVIQVNAALNNFLHVRLFENAIGGADGEQGEMFLYNSLNTGMSSLTRGKFGMTGSATITFISPERVLKMSGVDEVDFCKVDVEGFEAQVVPALHALCQQGKIKKLLVEYHPDVLEGFGTTSTKLHESLLQHGMKSSGAPSPTVTGHMFYTRA